MSTSAPDAPLFPLRVFFRPSVVIELALGLAPLAGIAVWGWDTYLVLMLHLLALGISSLWLALRGLTLSPEALRHFDPARAGKPPTRGLRFMLAGFAIGGLGLPLVLFVGIITEQLGGPWFELMHGLGDFWRLVVVGSGLWLPLAGICAFEAFGFIADVVLPRLPLARRFRVPMRPVGPEWAALSGELKAFLHARAFVVLRMIVTALAVGVGLFLAEFFGLMALVVLLAAAKTAVGVLIEAGAIVDAERRARPAPVATGGAGPRRPPRVGRRENH